MGGASHESGVSEQLWLFCTGLNINKVKTICFDSSVGYSAQWATKTFPLSDLNPPCQPVKSRGALVPAFSPDGQLLAIILNQKQPKVRMIFIFYFF